MAKVKIKKLDPGAVIPKQLTPGAAGFDVVYPGPDNILIMPGKVALVPTGLAVEIEPGHEIQVRPRSGLALKEAVTVANAPGTIDSDYRGPCGVILHNIGDQPFTVHSGDRIAQFVVASVPEVELEEVQELSDTERGEGGFGSTGKQ